MSSGSGTLFSDPGSSDEAAADAKMLVASSSRDSLGRSGPNNVDRLSGFLSVCQRQRAAANAVRVPAHDFVTAKSQQFDG